MRPQARSVSAVLQMPLARTAGRLAVGEAMRITGSGAGGDPRPNHSLLEIRTHRLIRRAASPSRGLAAGSTGGGAEVVGQGASLPL